MLEYWSDEAALEIILDTSFLLEIVSKPLRRLDELDALLGRVELAVLDTTLFELEYMCRKRGVKARRALTALEYAKRLKMHPTDRRLDADSAIIRYAVEKGCTVATMDQDLRQRLRSMGVAVVTLRDDNIWVDR